MFHLFYYKLLIYKLNQNEKTAKTQDAKMTYVTEKTKIFSDQKEKVETYLYHSHLPS